MGTSVVRPQPAATTSAATAAATPGVRAASSWWTTESVRTPVPGTDRAATPGSR